MTTSAEGSSVPLSVFSSFSATFSKLIFIAVRDLKTVLYYLNAPYVAKCNTIDPNTEPPPEIPEELKGRRCYYGLSMSDETFRTTSIGAPDDPKRYLSRLTEVSMLMHEMGLFCYVNVSCLPAQDSDEWVDCCMFSSDWEVAAKYECPTRAKLEELCERLGVAPTEMKWHPW